MTLETGVRTGALSETRRHLRVRYVIDLVRPHDEHTIKRASAILVVLNTRNTQLQIVSKRLLWFLVVLVAVGVPGAFFADFGRGVPTPVAVLFVGLVGGFVGLQRRLKSLPGEDLALLAESWPTIALSPIAGAILAELVYLLFISGLLKGKIFPEFEPDGPGMGNPGLRELFAVHCKASSDYAMVLFWSFVAGFSEKFATNIISQFESHEPGLDRAEGRARAQADTPDGLPSLNGTSADGKSMTSRAEDTETLR